MCTMVQKRNWASVIARHGTLLQELDVVNPPLLQIHVCRRFPKYTHILPDGSYELPPVRE